MKPETKLWHELKRITPKISWTRLENTSVLGTPDLLGYNTFGHFFTVELKITSNNKIRFSPHQISFHIQHPKNTFILANCFQVPVSCHLLRTDSSLKTLVACRLMLVDFFYLRLVLEDLRACGLSLATSGCGCLLLVACRLRLPLNFGFTPSA